MWKVNLRCLRSIFDFYEKALTWQQRAWFGVVSLLLRPLETTKRKQTQNHGVTCEWQEFHLVRFRVGTKSEQWQWCWQWKMGKDSLTHGCCCCLWISLVYALVVLLLYGFLIIGRC